MAAPLLSLTDPRASARAQGLYHFLQEQAGKRVLLAQQESPVRVRHDQEMEYLQRVTGRLPVMRGLDFIHNDFDGVVERALRWNDRGGLVTICWHTGVEGIGYPESQKESPDFDRLLSPGTPENGLLLSRWEACVRALRRLGEADVPVLWRPFHEFDGQWFWWGKGGGDAFQALWRMMYRCFTQEGLHHLIWVLGYADDVRPGWYPGDDFCDVLGSDTYKTETCHAASYRRLKALSPQKPLAFHECGLLPPPDAFFQEGAPWAWVMPWHGKWLMQDQSPDRLREIYRDSRMVTLQDGISF